MGSQDRQYLRKGLAMALEIDELDSRAEAGGFRIGVARLDGRQYISRYYLVVIRQDNEVFGV